VGSIGVYKDSAVSNFETKLLKPLLHLFPAGESPFLAKLLHVVSRSVLWLVRLDGRMEVVRSVFDLKVKGVVGPGDFVDGAKDVLLPDETEGTIDIVDDGEVDLLGSHR